MGNWFDGIEALHYFTVHNTLSCAAAEFGPGTACGIPKARLRQRKIMTTCTEKHHPNHPHRHGPNCGHTAIGTTAMWTTFTMAICTMRTRIMSTNMPSQSTPLIPCTARLNSAAHTRTALIADTKRYRMVTTSITL